MPANPAAAHPQIWVANHTSMIDYAILCSYRPFAVIMQLHGGWIRFIQTRVRPFIGSGWGGAFAAPGHASDLRLVACYYRLRLEPPRGPPGCLSHLGALWPLPQLCLACSLCQIRRRC